MTTTATTTNYRAQQQTGNILISKALLDRIILGTEMHFKISRRFTEFLAFIWSGVTRRWSFQPILLLWNARFSLLLVPAKYSYALSQQPSWHVPSYFWQIDYASPCAKILSGRGLLGQRLTAKQQLVKRVPDFQICVVFTKFVLDKQKGKQQNQKV